MVFCISRCTRPSTSFASTRTIRGCEGSSVEVERLRRLVGVSVVIRAIIFLAISLPTDEHRRFLSPHSSPEESDDDDLPSLHTLIRCKDVGSSNRVVHGPFDERCAAMRGAHIYTHQSSIDYYLFIYFIHDYE